MKYFASGNEVIWDERGVWLTRQEWFQMRVLQGSTLMVFKIARGVHWRPPNPFNAKGKKITERKYRATSVQQSTIVIKLKKTKKKRKMPKGIGKWTISKLNDSIN